ncbi:hypothetical protein OK015_02045 [Mycobacterium sp. Aquia_216]|uniref:hypothetical protein n=1 Tax=Mycobacterium sp. Aquia_216 TaxID=2991729 RepID=UPI00227BC58D|nr:hypothetical protein [Mycobacterium sp. Aquia_216]WAJ45334.1 hypothetical protein OK015_02045 [Mycobacterium sp. Aquia_216]
MNPTSVTDPNWRVESTSEVHSYRFVNLQDHTAWRVIIHGENGFGVEISGHVSYGRGSFCQHLEPGSYWLTWDNTLSMLTPRVGEAPRPKLESPVFSVPLAGPAAIELAAVAG